LSDRTPDQALGLSAQAVKNLNVKSS